MYVVRRNIFANLVGGALLAGLTIVVTPLQINILGMEAYGVVGFITTLQIAFTAFDLGLSGTLTREIASDHSDGKRSSRELLRTAMTIYWVSAIAIGLAIAGAAGTIAERWFKVNALDVDVLATSLKIVALYLALRWPVALYTGVLSGLQRMDVLNAAKVSTAALRLVGGVAVLLHWRTLEAFLWWTAVNAVIELMVFALACHHVHPSMPMRPGLSMPSIRRVWRFSVSLNALSVLAVLIIQLDRLTISKVLPLDDLGAYSLAYTAASTISLIVAAVSSAVLPSFAATQGRDPPGELVQQYNRADRAMLTLVGIASFSLIAYGDVILTWWINSEAAASASRATAVLAAGFWCGAAMANVYNVAIARGLPGRFLRANVILVVPYALAMYLAVEAFGIIGAAWVWLALNVVYMLVLVHPVHEDVLRVSTKRWIASTLVPAVTIGVLAFGAPRLAAELYGASQSAGLVLVVALLVSLLLYGCFSLHWLELPFRNWSAIRSRFSR
ncbi:MAG TPA: oligosaccharide flippase family protein [Caldimonas sp.]|jgi:O-antigen/teichoic acid export membrane protein|nr:oligosaccharide flippase family protein [Caldimonas sp.]HEX2542304.1 oligosaccharide flippase family protein [Caldimonas sp.]